MLSERPSGLWWGCRTTQVEASDAQPELGGPASISPIHGPCVHTHTHTQTAVQALKHTHPLSNVSKHAVTRMPSLLPHRGLQHTLTQMSAHISCTPTTGNSHKVRALPKLFTALVKRGILCVHLWSVGPQGFWVCVYVGGEVTLSLPTHSIPYPQR